MDYYPIYDKNILRKKEEIMMKHRKLDNQSIKKFKHFKDQDCEICGKNRAQNKVEVYEKCNGDYYYPILIHFDLYRRKTTQNKIKIGKWIFMVKTVYGKQNVYHRINC